MPRILVVDDEEQVRGVVAKVLGTRFEVETAADGEAALAQVADAPPDCVLLDIQMPGLDGIEVLERIRASDESIPVIMLSGVKEVETAVTALKRGAYDFLTKPPHFDAVFAAVDRALERTSLLAEVRRLRGELNRAYGIPGIVGRHPQMLRIYELIGRLASRRAPVLLTGESGTGKELIARAIHQHGNRGKGPFVAVNCAAIPDTLFEAEFFGHVKGAYTDAKTDRAGHFEQANGGTLFLDEVGELSVPNQAKLLRVLQEQEVTRLGSTRATHVDVRVVSATNRSLEQMVEEGTFRKDLYFRLNVIPIQVPSLRERPSDIPLLVGHFIARIARQEGEQPKGVSPEVMRRLQTYRWPGNVRELENVVERLMAMTPGDTIREVALPAEFASVRDSASEIVQAVLSGDLTLVEAVEDLERRVIEQALERCDGNKSAAAQMIGISRRMLRYKLERGGAESNSDESPSP